MSLLQRHLQNIWQNNLMQNICKGIGKPFANQSVAEYLQSCCRTLGEVGCTILGFVRDDEDTTS